MNLKMAFYTQKTMSETFRSLLVYVLVCVEAARDSSGLGVVLLFGWNIFYKTMPCKPFLSVGICNGVLCVVNSN